jgi:GntR family transcriptional regulator
MYSLDQIPGIPLYIQIREKIRQDIVKGIFVPGQKIPSEEQLAKNFGVSRMTVRQGLAELLAEGLLHKQQGVGTFVSHVRISANYSRMTSFTQDALEQGKNPSSILLGITKIPVDMKVASTLALKKDEAVVCLERLRKVDDQPVAIQRSLVPQRICPPDLEQYDWSKQSLFELLEKQGVRLIRAIETINARLADEEQAKLLEIETGGPILYIERITFSDNGLPVEFVKMYNRPDRYSCTITLFR